MSRINRVVTVSDDGDAEFLLKWTLDVTKSTSVQGGFRDSDFIRISHEVRDLHLIQVAFRLTSLLLLLKKAKSLLRPHPAKEAANGRLVVVAPLLLWSDETTGNSSIRYNKFESWFVRHCGTCVADTAH